MHPGVLAARIQSAQQSIARAAEALAKEFGVSVGQIGGPHAADPNVRRLLELESIAMFLDGLAQAVSTPDTQDPSPSTREPEATPVAPGPSESSDGDEGNGDLVSAGVDETIAGMLDAAGLNTVDAVAASTDEDLLAVKGIGFPRLEKIRAHIPYRAPEE